MTKDKTEDMTKDYKDSLKDITRDMTEAIALGSTAIGILTSEGSCQKTTDS